MKAMTQKGQREFRTKSVTMDREIAMIVVARLVRGGYAFECEDGEHGVMVRAHDRNGHACVKRWESQR